MIVDLGALANRQAGGGTRTLASSVTSGSRQYVPIRALTRAAWRPLSGTSCRQPVLSTARHCRAQWGEDGGRSRGPTQRSDTIVVNGRKLPRPTEGERIPAPHEGGPTSPDQSIYTVWTSPSEHHLVFVNAGDKARYEALHRRIDELRASLPHRSGNLTLALRLNQLSRWFPPPVLWLVLGLVALAWRRPAGAIAFATPAVAALLVIVLDAMAIPSVPHYSVPAAPAFVPPRCGRASWPW